MSIEQAAAMGFRRDQVEPALRIIEASAASPETLAVAMDLARYLHVPLADATDALIIGPRWLRRFGLIVPPGADPLAFVREQVAGQAEAYTTTFYGSMAVREAQGHTFSRAFLRSVERVFGPR